MDDDPNVKFTARCLHCGAEDHSINYTCSHHRQAWVNEYRAMDLDIELNDTGRANAVRSFYQYRFDHPCGMLQYAVLPYRQYMTENLEPVGMTPLHKLGILGKQTGCELYIKDEASNPSGCFKDRETLMCLLNSRKRDISRAVIYSSGNAAASAALMAQRINLKLITFVAGDTYDEKIDYIREHGSDVIVIGDEHTNFEEGFRIFAQLNANKLFSNNNFDNWSVRNPFRVVGDKTSAVEIAKQLACGDNHAGVPDYVVVPTANGSCLAGVWKGFKELYALGIIPRLPKMVSCGIKNANPVYEAVQHRQIDSPVVCDLSGLHGGDEAIGSTIIAEEGYDSIEAAKAVIESNGLATVVDESQIKRAMYDFLDKERDKAIEHSILPEPCSYISLAAAKIVTEKEGLNSRHKVVSLITGHGLKAKELIEELLEDRQDLRKVVEKIMDSRKKNMSKAAIEKGRRVTVEADADAVREAFNKMQGQPV